MNHHIPFPIENFENYCLGLHRVGVDPGFLMYTNHHASHHRPAARFLPTANLEAAQAYIANPTDQGFTHLVEAGVLLDTEWDRKTEHWSLIAFEGWEALHTAFSRLYSKSLGTLEDFTGVHGLDIMEAE